MLFARRYGQAIKRMKRVEQPSLSQAKIVAYKEQLLDLRNLHAHVKNLLEWVEDKIQRIEKDIKAEEEYLKKSPPKL